MTILNDQIDFTQYFENPNFLERYSIQEGGMNNFIRSRFKHACIWYWTGVLSSLQWNREQQETGNLVNFTTVYHLANKDSENIYRGEVYEVDGRAINGFDPDVTSHLSLICATKDLAWKLAFIIRMYGLVNNQQKSITPKELVSLARHVYAIEYGVTETLLSPVLYSAPASIKSADIDIDIKQKVILDLFEFFFYYVNHDVIIDNHYSKFFL